jgi:hypothetical protein
LPGDQNFVVIQRITWKETGNFTSIPGKETMAYNEHLADRVRKIFKEKRIRTEEKKMMGGLCFMVKDKMCLGVEKERLMARVGPEAYEDALKKKGCRPMDFTGRPLKGFVYVEPDGIDMDNDLEYWIGLCLSFNPKAKSSKKKLD